MSRHVTPCLVTYTSWNVMSCYGTSWHVIKTTKQNYTKAQNESGKHKKKHPLRQQWSCDTQGCDGNDCYVFGQPMGNTATATRSRGVRVIGEVTSGIGHGINLRGYASNSCTHGACFFFNIRQKQQCGALHLSSEKKKRVLGTAHTQ